MTKIIRVIGLLVVLSSTVLFYQNCGQVEMGTVETSDASNAADLPPSEQLDQPASSLTCTKQLDKEIRFQGPGGALWTHELVGSLPNLRIRFSQAQPVLEYAKLERELRVPDPNECSWAVIRMNKDPNLNRGKAVPLSGADLTSEHHEVVLVACTDSWARFVSLHHYARHTSPEDGVIIAGNYGVWSNPVFHGVLGMGDNCVSSVAFEPVRFKKNFFYNVVTVTRQDGKQDLSFITYDGGPITRVFRMQSDLGASQSKYASLSNIGALELSSCPGDSPTALIQVTDNPDKFEISSTIQCGATEASPKFVLISRDKNN